MLSKLRFAPLQKLVNLLLLPVLLATALPSWAAGPLRIGYSDWPGWVAWQIAIEKDWFKEAGVDVKFE